MAEDLANLATVGVVIDGSGGRREIQMTVEQLKELANTGKMTEAVMKRTIPPTIVPPAVPQQINAVTAAIVRTERQAVALAAGSGVTTAELNKLRQGMQTLAVSAGVLPGPIGRVAASLAPFAVGGVATIGILGGLAGISYAFKQLTEEGDKAREMMTKLQDGSKNFSAEALRARITTLALQERNLAAGLEASGRSPLERREARSLSELRDAITGPGRRDEELQRTRNLANELGAILAKLDRDASSDSAAAAAKDLKAELEKVAEAWRRVRDEHDAWFLKLQQSAPTVKDMISQVAQWRIEAHDSAQSLREFTLSNLDDNGFAERQQKALEDTVRQLKVQFETVAKIAEKEKERHETLRRIGELVAVQALQNLTQFGGDAGAILGSTAQGALSGGAATKSALGAAAGGIIGLTTALAGLARASKEAQAAAYAMQLSLSENIATIRMEISGAGDLDKALLQNAQQFRRLRDQIIQAYAGSALEGERTRRLQELNQLEGQRAEYLRQQTAEMNAQMQEDLQVRLLRAQGRSEEADAMAQQLARVREYTQAVRAGADATTLAALAEVQRAEMLAASITKVQARIDSLSGTISGLQDFQNALKLGDASLSPTQRLAEANRQYQEVAALAMGGDQAAAGRLPAAAQAFLDASRAVNASGPAFQADFLRVLDDTQAAIDKFADLRTIEELMLEELKAIRGNTEPREIGDVIPREGPLPQLPTVDLEPLITVSAEGSRQIANRLDSVVSTLDGLVRATRSIGDGLQVSRSNT